MNPFSTDSQFCKLNSSYIFPDAVSQDFKRVFVLGENLHSDFLCTILVVCSGDLNKKKIIKNSLKLPKDSVEVGAEKPCISIDEKLINKLCDAWIQGAYWLNRSSKENRQVPEYFITKECTPYLNTKSAILDCITSDQAYIENQLMMDALWSTCLCNQVSGSFTFIWFNIWLFSSLVIDRITKITESCNAQRTDTVTDQYTERSLKSPTRFGGKSKSFC